MQKAQHIAHLFNKVQEVSEIGDPGLGIFTVSFNREVSELGTYYTVTFDWRERQSEEEKQQLDLIADFVLACGDQLVDLEGTRSMLCVDRMKAQELQTLTAQRQELSGNHSQRSLPAS
jgi:hypothetical protein